MRLLDTITVDHPSGKRQIHLCHGDLTDLPPTHAVDLLILSAFPDDYWPTPTSLIGALHAKGISVEELAQNKAVDLRGAFSCWLSQEVIVSDPSIQFKRILCFEPLVRGRPTEVVGEIFQSLMPFAHGDPPITRVAMPLVACGNQGVSISEMLEPLVHAAMHWLGLGLPIEHLYIVDRSAARAEAMHRLFAHLKQRHLNLPSQRTSNFKHDLFISYSHENRDAVDFMDAELRRLRPQLRVFLDRCNLNAGMAWQQKIFEALDECRMVAAVYSPAYLHSKVCKEEFNIALFRHREANENVLLPIYLYSADLPTYMKLIHFIDCREGDSNKLKQACTEIIKIAN